MPPKVAEANAPPATDKDAVILVSPPLRITSPPPHTTTAPVDSATPGTAPRNVQNIRGRQVAASLTSASNQVPERGKEYLYNIDLHGLQPTLSVRTRILLSTWALLQMPPSDIAKSFEVAGYVPRKRPAKLQAALNYYASKNGDLQPGEQRQSRRSVIDKVGGKSLFLLPPPPLYVITRRAMMLRHVCLT